MNLLSSLPPRIPFSYPPYMSETLILPQTTQRQELYESLLPQLRALTESEPDLIANLANITAALKEAFGFFWVGFYLKKDGQLVLGPFQGPIACTRINFGKGVCGTSYSRRETMLVPDVEQFPGHIACSSLSKSEIVVPVFDQAGNVAMVLDVDSDQLNDFSATDQQELEKIAALITALLKK
ncbi:GAF domain-containing protein [Larkinella ripae]